MEFKYVLLVLIISLISSAVANKYIGCYRVVPPQKTLMNDGFKEFSGTLTNDKCFDYCLSLNMNYAGLQYGRECYCSKTIPTFISLVDDFECDIKCEGNENEICGGKQLLSVFDLDVGEANFQLDEYKGCFEEYNEVPILNDMYQDYGNMLTPHYCMAQCWRNGYRFAGVKYGSECRCGDRIVEGDKVTENYCSIPCQGDKRLKCGGGEHLSIYSTGLRGFSKEGRLIGCFVDDDERLISEFGFVMRSNLAPNRCISLCNFSGYKYAGLYYKIQCHCGNRRPPSSLITDINECSNSCPGELTSLCGGNFRNLIYKAGNITINIRTFDETVSEKPTVTQPKPLCKTSITTVNGKTVCKGDVIFHEDFNQNIDRTKWMHSIFMPWEPDYDFVTFTNKPENSFVAGGNLVIKPTLLNDVTVRRGEISLKDCTGEPNTVECARKAASFSILPPIESARLSTKQSFSFKYGRVDIRAKLPEGDWLYPELYIEPTKQTYGKAYASGRIRIAGARGNSQLKHLRKEIGGTMLEAGVILGNMDEIKARSVVSQSSLPWSSGFHNYTVLWTPENIWFMVDGQSKQALLPPEAEGRLFELISFQNGVDSWSTSNVEVAPFDEESYIAVGLTAGGIRYFPDGAVSGTYEKPWMNGESKAMLQFLRAKPKWTKSWNEENIPLLIDSIKVTAL